MSNDNLHRSQHGLNLKELLLTAKKSSFFYFSSDRFGLFLSVDKQLFAEFKQWFGERLIMLLMGNQPTRPGAFTLHHRPHWESGKAIAYLLTHPDTKADFPPKALSAFACNWIYIKSPALEPNCMQTTPKEWGAITILSCDRLKTTTGSDSPPVVAL